MSAENPKVNRYLQNKHFDHMDHALGRPMWPDRETTRNYFATEADGALAKQFSATAHWALSGQREEMAYFHVTDAGIAALIQHLAEHDPNRAFTVNWEGHSEIIPATSRSKAKYKYYLAVSDLRRDLRFVDFSRTARVRRAA